MGRKIQKKAVIMSKMLFTTEITGEDGLSQPSARFIKQPKGTL